MYDLLISDAEVLTIDPNFAVLPHHDVAVQGSRIAAIGPAGSLGPAARIISGRGQILMPGLVNTHTHVGMAYYKGTAAAMELFKWLAWGWFYIQRMTPEDIHWATRLSCLEMIRAGVTTFCDQYFTRRTDCPGGGSFRLASLSGGGHYGACTRHGRPHADRSPDRRGRAYFQGVGQCCRRVDPGLSGPALAVCLQRAYDCQRA